MTEVVVDGVSLFRCAFCGGLWLSPPALAAVARRRLDPEPLRGHTDRRCPTCNSPLSTAVLKGVPVEVCGACEGCYLDDGEVVELAGREISWRRDHPERSDRVLDFRCIGCTERFDVRDGHATSGGLSCSRCLGAVELGKVGPQPMALGLRDELASRVAESFVPGGGLLYLAWKFFIRS